MYQIPADITCSKISRVFFVVRSRPSGAEVGIPDSAAELNSTPLRCLLNAIYSNNNIIKKTKKNAENAQTMMSFGYLIDLLTCLFIQGREPII